MPTVADYLELITAWHRGRPKFEATVEAMVTPLVQLQEFLAHLPQDFDIDEAIGAQLDVDGEWVGRNRFVDVPIPDLWFSWDDPVRGWDKGIWKSVYDSEFGITRLDDEVYRMLLYAKIAANHWDGTVETAKEALDKFFVDPETKLLIEDKQDMSMVFGMSGKVPSVLYLMLFSKGYIPLKPEGVKTHYLVTSIDQTPLFGFDVSNEYIRGWDEGSWGVTPDYIAQNPLAHLPMYSDINSQLIGLPS